MYGSLAAAFVGGRWRGVLLLGASGSGKSDLCVRLAAQGWRLVADDRVVVWRVGREVFGRPPPPLRGMVELRGQGLARLASLAFASIDLVADLGEPAERQPEAESLELAGVRRPHHRLRPFDASAPARLSLLLGAL